MSAHLSSQQISLWLAGEHDAADARHLSRCPSCAAEVAQAESLFAQFAESARRWSEQPAPLAAPSPRWRAAIAAAAVSLLAAALVIHRPAPPADEPFVEIPYVAPLAPYERTEIVRAEVPITTLLSAGFDVPLSTTRASLPADLLIGQDGRAHAIRFQHRSLFE